MAGTVQQSSAYFNDVAYEGVPRQSKAPASAPSKHSTDTSAGALVELLRGVAGRTFDPAAQAKAPAFDVPQVAAALRGRISGLELNLCNLAPGEEACLKIFTPQDWEELQAAAASGGGAGIAYVELEAELLAHIRDGLQLLPNLDCVSVWAPLDGGTIDFGNLKGKSEPLRINILGSPENPLAITVLEGTKVQCRDLNSPAIRDSVVYTKSEPGDTNTEQVPLGLASPTPPAVHVPADDLSVGLNALMRCGRYDASGSFGIDLRNMTSEQVRCVQALGAEVWAALQADAKRAGLKISWLHLHKDVIVDGKLTLALKQLSSLVTLTVATPPQEACTPPELPQPVDPLGAAMESLLGCIDLDDSGQLGLDLTALSPEQVSGVQALGVGIWSAVGADARIKWLCLHDDFKLTPSLVLGLKQLTSLVTLSVATPKRGILVGLAQLHGTRLREVHVRCGPERKWVIMVPHGVKVQPSIEFDDADALLRQSKILYELDGNVVREELLFKPPTEV